MSTRYTSSNYYYFVYLRLKKWNTFILNKSISFTSFKWSPCVGNRISQFAFSPPSTNSQHFHGKCLWIIVTRDLLDVFQRIVFRGFGDHELNFNISTMQNLFNHSMQGNYYANGRLKIFSSSFEIMHED